MGIGTSKEAQLYKLTRLSSFDGETVRAITELRNNGGQTVYDILKEKGETMD